MSSEKPPFRVRLATAVNALQGKTKDYIPSLGSLNDQTFGPAGAINLYDTKRDQVGANQGWVFTANDAITEPTAAVKLTLHRKKADGDREEIKGHEILDLLNSPSIAFSGKQVRELHFTYLNLVGESYQLMRSTGAGNFKPGRDKLPSALEIFPAHEVEFKLGDGSYSSSIVKYNKQEFPITSVLRDHRPDPANPYYGRSIIRAAAQTIDMEHQMKRWNQNLFAHSGRPSLIFSTNEPLSDDSFRRWQEQFTDDHTGTENAFKPLMVEGGDAKPFMLSNQDLDFINSRKFSRDELLAMFKISPGLIGIVENVNRANLDAGFYINAMVNVMPRIQQYVDVLNATLVTPYDPALELSFENPVPEDVAAKLSYAKAAAGNNAFLTVDEVRDLYGEKPLADDAGTHVIVSGTLTTLDQAIEEKPDEPVVDPNAPTPVPTPDEDPNATPAAERDEEKKAFDASPDGVKKKTLRLRRALIAATRR